METKANYFLVGSFVLAGFLSIIIFLVWLSKANFGESTQTYDIYFKGSVTGLKNGAMVQYRGVPIGVVKGITIKPTDIEIIQVQVSVERDVALREDVIAVLETQGLTGLAFIQIKGGTNEAPLLTKQQGQRYPVIPAKSSLLEEVAGSVPEILGATNHIIEQLQDVLSEENRQAFHQTVQNIEQITTFLSPKNKEDNLFNNLKKSAGSIEQTMKELQDMLTENRSNIKDFSTAGFDSFAKFMQEGRETMASIKRLSESIERSPSRFLYNDSKQGVRP